MLNAMSESSCIIKDVGSAAESTAESTTGSPSSVTSPLMLDGKLSSHSLCEGGGPLNKCVPWTTVACAPLDDATSREQKEKEENDSVDDNGDSYTSAPALLAAATSSRSVHFSRVVRVRRTRSLRNYTSLQIEQCWYQQLFFEDKSLTLLLQ